MSPGVKLARFFYILRTKKPDCSTSQRLFWRILFNHALPGLHLIEECTILIQMGNTCMSPGLLLTFGALSNPFVLTIQRQFIKLRTQKYIFFVQQIVWLCFHVYICVSVLTSTQHCPSAKRLNVKLLRRNLLGGDTELEIALIEQSVNDQNCSEWTVFQIEGYRFCGLSASYHPMPLITCLEGSFCTFIMPVRILSSYPEVYYGRVIFCIFSFSDWLHQ